MLYFKCLHIISFYFGHIITVDDVNKCFLFSWIAGDKIAHNLCFGNKLTVGVNGPSPLFPVSNTGTLHKDKHHNSLLCKYITHYEESNIKDCLFPPLLSLSLTPPLSDQCSTAVARACFFLTSGGQNCNQFYRGNSPHTQTAIADLFFVFRQNQVPLPLLSENKGLSSAVRDLQFVMEAVTWLGFDSFSRQTVLHTYSFIFYMKLKTWFLFLPKFISCNLTENWI